MKQRTFTINALLALTLLWTGEVVAQAGHDDHAHGDDNRQVVELSRTEQDEFGITTALAGPGVIAMHLELAGEVRPNDDRLAHIVPRFDGIVTEVIGHIGDIVDEGHVLAIVEGDESLAPFPIKTLISGTVLDKHITLGEAVSRDRTAFVIADLSRVWIDLTVYQRDLNRIAVGQEAQLFVGHNPIDGDATISYITPVVDEQTRTATARLVVPNPDGSWRPGMFVTAQVLVERTEVAVVVPRTALHNIAGHTVVFIATDHGFEPVEVEVGLVGISEAEIVSGLTAGTAFVSQGGFTIKAELDKESFGDGHAH